MATPPCANANRILLCDRFPHDHPNGNTGADHCTGNTGAAAANRDCH
jgi:hypothetical protein